MTKFRPSQRCCLYVRYRDPDCPYETGLRKQPGQIAQVLELSTLTLDLKVTCRGARVSGWT